MPYKSTCPKCGARLSRADLLMNLRLYYTCRTCGAKFRISGVGWLFYFAVIFVQLGWYGLYRIHIFSANAGTLLVLLTLCLAAWWGPILTPMKLKVPGPEPRVK